MRKGCLEEKIQDFVARKRRPVFMRTDFKEICSDYDQVGRALNNLVKRGKLIKVGYGLYAKTKTSKISGKPIPSVPLQEIGKASLRRLKVITGQTQAEWEYNQGLSTQVPTGRVIGVKGRISRKIAYNGIPLTFERIRPRSAQR